MTTPSYSTLPPGRVGRSCIPIPFGAPRDLRIGGYAMTLKTAEEWAARILGVQELSRAQTSRAVWSINDRIKPHRAKLDIIGDDVNNVFCMIVTHRAGFRGHVGMPDWDIPQFTPNERDVLARKLLLDEGVKEEDFQFQTWLS
ncbi:hypothetical protein FPV67DRAFT_1495123 [Lyophyllum atratum]|nr:hypothetical protein FPV67DRAFT_1495123 [Lyophyllum atratum]